MPYAFIPEKAANAIPDLSGVAVKVLVAVATFMPGRDQGGCYPSLAAIGERTGIKREKTLTAAIKELVAAGVVVCERRKRQTNLLKWANLDPAESAGTRIQDPAVSAPPNPLEPAVSVPLDHVLDPAVSAQVYPAVSAPRKVPNEGTQTAIAQNDEKPLSPETETPLATDAENPKAEGEKQPPPAEPKKLKLTPPPAEADDGTKSSSKSKAKKPAKAKPPVDAEAAERIVTAYAELVKPRTMDSSGSRKVFLNTAAGLLAKGTSESDLMLAMRNYAASRVQLERQEKDPESARKYRFGFQTFFGPKFEHWRDYLTVTPDSERFVDPDDDNWEISEADAAIQLQFERDLAAGKIETHPLKFLRIPEPKKTADHA